MAEQVKEEWIINNRNIFGLPQDINLSLSSIQFEILDQIEDKKINSISDYLGAEIDITNELFLTQSLTIKVIFKDFLGIDNFHQLGANSLNCHMILLYLQLTLFNEYYSESHKNILPFSEYQSQYNKLLENYLSSNIDTDEQDFIKTELTLCENLITELDKPIYNVISPLNKILDKPCEFKKNLINSIDKRKKHLKQKENELVPKIKALFKFIEFLHSNIDSFKKYDEVINELHLLDKERQKVTPRKNFADKLKYDEVQAKIEDKFKVIQENIIKLIQAKATELNICNLNKTETLWNWNISEISNLKENFSKKDLPEIFRHKRKYLEYRTKTNCTYFQDFFFNDLDEILKELFDYFKETKQNEFEHFEAKSLQVNSFEEAIKEIQKGHTKFTLPNAFLSNPSNIQQPKNEAPPQPIKTKADILKENLQKGGFYNLEKVQALTEPNQNELINLISENMAYSIAMFDYLGFCDFLDNEKGTKYKANHYLSRLYNENAKDGTQAKHYRNSLINNKKRYTSYLHKEKVIKDYEKLK